MTLAKGFIQATIVVLWAVYVVVQLVTDTAASTDASADPTGGAGLLVGFLETLPIESLVVPTVVMIVALLGLEVLFVAIRRAG